MYRRHSNIILRGPGPWAPPLIGRSREGEPQTSKLTSGETASSPNYKIHFVHFSIQSNPESVKHVYLWTLIQSSPMDWIGLLIQRINPV